MGASLQTWGQVPCWHTGMFVNRQLFLAGRWCQAFSFLPGTVPQKNTPMPAFCAREIYCTMRQQSFQARFSAGLRGVRSGSQMCVERSLVPDQAKGSAWLLLCWPCKPLVWLWLSPWGDMGIGQAAIPNLFLYCVRGHAAGGGKSSLVSLCACAAVLFQKSAICDPMKAHLMEQTWNMYWQPQITAEHEEGFWPELWKSSSLRSMDPLYISWVFLQSLKALGMQPEVF